jgi:DNA processing protein
MYSPNSIVLTKIVLRIIGMKDLPKKNIEYYLALQLAKIPRANKNKILLQNAVCTNHIQAIKKPNWHLINKALTWEQNSNNHHIITFGDPRYPASLKEITSPPIVLFCKGKLDLLTNIQIAIVGSRRATAHGEDHAYSFAKSLSSIGLTVTSGLAKGIDAAAAAGALSSGGKTIAVLGTGIDVVYPKCNYNLYNQIANEGLIISAFPLETPPLATNFPGRNRIISGLSKGVLIVEAEQNSGSLITAKYGIEQNREIFAIPGPINTSNYSGCHLLIQQGAKLTRNPNDIFDEILPSINNFKNLNNARLEADSKDKQYLLSILNSKPLSIDHIIAKSNLNRSRILSSILELEVNKFVKYQNGGYVKRYD